MTNQTLVGVMLAVATLGATVARADEHGHFRGGYEGRGGYEHRGWEHREREWDRRADYGRRWVEPVRPGFGFGLGYRSNRGHYETRYTQVWIPGAPSQVWVEGGCDGYGQCTQGGYRTVMSPGHYETRPTSVWVAW